MPEVHEAYGYPVGDRSNEAHDWRLTVQCPFIGADCDGGGNRYSTHIHFANRPGLASLYPGRTQIPSGVCSIKAAETSPWIVCPRRLLVLGRSGSTRAHQQHIEDYVLSLTGYSQGARVGVWSEAKFKIANPKKSFDYTFDYVAMPVNRQRLDEAASACGLTPKALEKVVRASGYAVTSANGTLWVEDFPCGVPTVIEIMTSSTSGSNKTTKTTIADAFEHAILGTPHTSPGINKRQVWARMVSQLIVKSEVGEQWGGKTLWILQDNLVEYISQSTGLDIQEFTSTQTSVVNIVAIGYGSKAGHSNGIVELPEIKLYAGTVATQDGDSSFLDIIRAPMVPPISALFELLAKKGPAVEYLTA